MLDETYNNLLRQALLGRKVRTDRMPVIHRCRPMLSFWGSDAGIPSGDIHHNRCYRIYLDYTEARTITVVDVVVDGELLSPCSGYAYEALDEFDYPLILEYCLSLTEA